MDPHEKSHECLNGTVSGNQTFGLALFPLIFVLLLVVLSILRFSVFALRCFNRHEWIINLEKLWSSLPNRIKGIEFLKNVNFGFLSSYIIHISPGLGLQKVAQPKLKIGCL